MDINTEDFKSREEYIRLRDNLRRLGCFFILYSYEELKQWARPKSEYTQKQKRAIERGDDPLFDLWQFFYGEDGLDKVVYIFDINIDPAQIQRFVKPIFSKAKAFIGGKPIPKEDNQEEYDWDVLIDVMARKVEEEAEEKH